jgi:LacI family transcriptional regulator
VDADVEEAIVQAVAHLKSLGHTRIAYLSMNLSGLNDSRQRSFVLATTNLWGPGVLAPIFGPNYPVEPDFDVNYYEDGILGAKQFYESKCQATAIVCFNDELAMGLMGHLQSLGVKIPGDLSVVGIDGHLAGAYWYPPLTTVSIEPHRHGAECAKLLIDLIEGRQSDALESIPCHLIVRRSTASV